MNKLGNEFLQCWDEFKTAVLAKVPPPPVCEDPVLIVTRNNGCLFALDANQLNTVLLLGTIHKFVELNIGVEEALSAALNRECVDILMQVTTLIRQSK